MQCPTTNPLHFWRGGREINNFGIGLYGPSKYTVSFCSVLSDVKQIFIYYMHDKYSFIFARRKFRTPTRYENYKLRIGLLGLYIFTYKLSFRYTEVYDKRI